MRDCASSQWALWVQGEVVRSVRHITAILDLNGHQYEVLQ